MSGTFTLSKGLTPVNGSRLKLVTGLTVILDQVLHNQDEIGES
jgi:hypothetical protein